MKRFLCGLLVVFAMLGCLSGCKADPEKNNPGTTQPPDSGTEEPKSPYDVYDDLGNLKFGTEKTPEEFTVLQWDSYQTDWCMDPGKNKNAIDEALFARQVYMEDRFGIVFRFVEVTGKYDGISEFNQRIEAGILNGLHAYDLAGHYSVGASLLITSGYAHNLLEVEHLNLSKSYWPKDLLEANVVNNQLYFLSGYLAPSYFGNIACVYYNQNMIQAMGYRDPIELVDSNQWTFAQMKEMALPLYQDTNNSGTVDRADTFGIVFNMGAAPIDALSVACGIRLMDIGDDGRLRLSPSCYNTKAIGVMDYLTDLVSKNDAVFLDMNSDNNTYGDIFPSARALFLVDQLGNMPTFLEKAGFTIGTVPLPKYDSSQTSFYNSVGPQFTMFTIPADAKDPDMSGAILEALEAYSYRELFPVIYEEHFKLQYSSNQDISRMVTLIYESATLDPAKTWGDAAAIYWVTRASVTGAESWSTRLAKYRDTTWQDNIESLNKYLFHENE